MTKITFDNNNRPLSDRYDVIKQITEVHSRNINKDITSDFVMADLAQNEREYVIAMTNNAYLCKSILSSMRNKLVNDGKIKQDREDENSVYSRLLKYEGSVFDILMCDPYMISIMNRNKILNPIVMKLIKGFDEDNSTTNSEEIESKNLVQRAVKSITKPEIKTE